MLAHRTMKLTCDYLTIYTNGSSGSLSYVLSQVDYFARGRKLRHVRAVLAPHRTIIMSYFSQQISFTAYLIIYFVLQVPILGSALFACVVNAECCRYSFVM